MPQFVMNFLNTYDDIVPVILMSLLVSLSATIIASTVGIGVGVPAALRNFKFKKLILRITDTLMGLPPVLMGLVVYLLLSRKGPLGEFELLFTPTAMIIAQVMLILPIIFGITVSNLSKNAPEVEKNCLALGAEKMDVYKTIITESKVQLLTVITLGFGRAISEVGAVMMVGGNIKGFTRVMTTYIALETGKGNFNGAVAIGIVLLIMSFMINFLLHRFQGGDA